MSHARYFKFLKLYADIWARRHCRVVLSGEEHLANVAEERRIYIVSHPTTWDLPMLAHIGRNNYYIVVADGPFASPIVRWLFTRAGFLKLEEGKGEETIENASRLIAEKNPLIYSLKGYGVDFGEDVRPRSGSIRIAHAARANIYPIHLMIEDGKRIMKGYRGPGGVNYPFTVFHDTLYFATFLPPLRYEEYAKPEMRYEDFQAIAMSLESSFQAMQRRIDADLKAGRYDGVPRRGGSSKRISY